jgi:acetyl esterase
MTSVPLQLRGRGGWVRARVSWPRPPGLDPGPGAALLVWLPGEGRGAGGAGLPAHRLFAEAGLTVLSVPWPARSEVPGEAAVQDAATALEWAADHAAELDADPARLLVAGEGLGAGLAAAVCLHARDQGWPIVGRQLLLFPRFAPGPASPLLAPSLAGLPPATVVTAEDDPAAEQGRRFTGRLRDAGVEVEEVSCRHQT